MPVTITLAAQRSADGFLLATSTEYGDGGTAIGTFPDSGTIFAMTPSVDIGMFAPYATAGAVRVDDILCDWN